ncbi:MAG TPA: alpha/beta hydrolase [Pseudonocardiaceae bacterium]|nr:alpha/beta hydrolase [Pseudonocardiaceae bacterium]
MAHVTSSDGTRIGYDRQGDGTPVILVGGAFQHRAIDHRTSKIQALLAEHFTVVHYDRRGRGESGDAPTYAVEREIEDIGALIDAVGGSAALYGMSSGAVLALDAAAAGLPVTMLALYEAPLVVDDGRPPVPSDAAERAAAAVAAGRPGDAVTLFMTECVGVPAEIVAGIRQSPKWAELASVAHTLPYDLTILRGTVSGAPLSTERWAAVTVPTLVIDGGASPPQMAGAANALADVLPNARRDTIPGQQHDVAPDLVVPVLTKFYGA